jgi:hypothetical protein
MSRVGAHRRGVSAFACGSIEFQATCTFGNSAVLDRVATMTLEGSASVSALSTASQWARRARSRGPIRAPLIRASTRRSSRGRSRSSPRSWCVKRSPHDPVMGF